MRRSFHLLLVLLVILVLGACSRSAENLGSPEAGQGISEESSAEPAQVSQQDPEPDPQDETVSSKPTYIFYNGGIITMDQDQPQAEAIAIQGNSILALGSNAEILSLTSEDTRVIDLDGNFLFPGFIDSHAHRMTAKANWGFDTYGEASDYIVSQGWTSVDELNVPRGKLAEILEADEKGEIDVRLNLYLAHNSFYGDPFGDWYMNYPPGEWISPHVRVMGIKIFIDFDSGRTLLFDQNQLSDLLMQLTLAGWQVSMKAVSIQSHELALGAIEQVLGDQSNDEYRFRLEHSVAVTDEQMVWMAEKGIIACIQPGFPGVLSYDPDMTRMAEENGFENTYRWSDYQDSGVFMVASPLNPQGDNQEHFEVSHVSPTGMMYRAVTQIGPNNLQPEPWMLEKTLTVEELLPLITINGAYVTFEEDYKGSLTPGKWADMVILSANPLEVTTDELLDISALMTMIDGEVVYCQEGFEDLCGMGSSVISEASSDEITIPPGGTIKIAVQGPMSGALSAFYPAMENTVNMALEDFGSGVGEFSVELIPVDDQCDQDAAGEIAAQLIETEPDLVAVIGPLCSSGVLGSFPVYEEWNIPAISGSTTQEDLSELFGDLGFNRTILNTAQLAQLGVEESYLDQSPKAAAFFTRYEQAFGAIPEGVRSYLPYTYDAVNLLLQAIDQSGTIDSSGALTIQRSELLAMIRSIQIDGLTGTVSIDEHGNRVP